MILPSYFPLAPSVFSATLGMNCFRASGVSFLGCLRFPYPLPGPQPEATDASSRQRATDSITLIRTISRLPEGSGRRCGCLGQVLVFLFSFFFFFCSLCVFYNYTQSTAGALTTAGLTDSLSLSHSLCLSLPLSLHR